MKSLAANLALPILLFTGCVGGENFDYTTSVINVSSLASTQSAVLAVLDQRDYIRSGRKSEAFVGLSRGFYGNPFDVKTTSGTPLANEMTIAVVAALKLTGIRAQTLAVRPAEGPLQARRALVQAGLDRALLLILTEWKTETMLRTSLSYDVTLEVLDRTGKELARKQISGKEVSNASILSAEKDAQKWFASKMTELLQDNAIADSLR